MINQDHYKRMLDAILIPKLKIKLGLCMKRSCSNKMEQLPTQQMLYWVRRCFVAVSSLAMMALFGLLIHPTGLFVTFSFGVPLNRKRNNPSTHESTWKKP